MILAPALLTCDAATRDPSGKVTLYGLFDRVLSARFPAVHGLFAIYWRCTVPGPGRLSVAILKPDGSVLADLDPVEVGQEGSQVMQGTHTLAGVQFPVDGDYSIILVFNGKEILRSGLTVMKGERG